VSRDLSNFNRIGVPLATLEMAQAHHLVIAYILAVLPGICESSPSVDACVDMSSTAVSAASGGQAPDCAVLFGVLGDCMVDVSRFWPSFAPGSLLWKICPEQGECKAICEEARVSTTTASSACSYDVADTEALAAYQQCLVDACVDMSSTAVSAASGGQAPDCASLKGFFGNCMMDVSPVMPSLAPGSLLWKICPEQGECKAICDDARGSTTTTASMTTTTTTATATTTPTTNMNATTITTNTTTATTATTYEGIESDGNSRIVPWMALPSLVIAVTAMI